MIHTQSAKIPSDHNGCAPPTDSNDSIAPRPAAMIPITRP